jgi:hypothetical protein
MFYYCKPMEYLKDLVADKSLMQHSNFHAVKKMLCKAGKEQPLWDEPWTGKEWWNMEVSDIGKPEI